MAALVGALIPLQTGANATIRMIFGHPAYAGIVNFSVGAIVIFLYALVAPLPVPNAQQINRVPWWGLLGGVVGVIYVLTVSMAARRLGATVLLVLVLTGQIVSSLICDQFGLLGFPRSPLTMSKLVGLGLVVLGVAVMRR